MSSHNITAMYDSRDAAQAARDALIDLGIDREDVEVHGDGAATSAEGEDGGFWHSIAGFLFPDSDKQLYTDGLRRGGYLLTAAVPDDLYDRAADLLEMTAPTGIDDRTSGWAGDAARPAGLGVDAAEYEPRSVEPARDEPIIPASAAPGDKIAEIEDEMGAGPRRELEERRRVRRYGLAAERGEPNLSSRPEEITPRIF